MFRLWLVVFSMLVSVSAIAGGQGVLGSLQPGELLLITPDGQVKLVEEDQPLSLPGVLVWLDPADRKLRYTSSSVMAADDRLVSEALPVRTNGRHSAPPQAVAPPQPPQVHVSALVSQGDAAFGRGDVTEARLFYRRAVDEGDGVAALRLGEMSDPAFLARAGVRMPGDAKEAAVWYQRAHELGVVDADLLLKQIPH
jgi:hypothetical protein